MWTWWEIWKKRRLQRKVNQSLRSLRTHKGFQGAQFRRLLTMKMALFQEIKALEDERAGH